jgi:hypothetical protein
MFSISISGTGSMSLLTMLKIYPET